MTEESRKVGEFIQRARIQKKMTQKELAVRLSVSPQYIKQGREWKRHERFGKRKYIFVREDAPELPMTYSRVSYHLQKAFYENGVCADDGKLLRCPTHLFRHTYGRKLTDLHVDDYVIARLLGHRGTRSVQNYRKMSDRQMAEEIRPVLDSIDEMIRRSRIKWRKRK